MKILGFGDPHIKPVDTAINYDALDVPPEIDVIVTNGDVVHRTESDDLKAGRQFFERLATESIPVLGVPGNHDPDPWYDTLVGGLSNVTNIHKQVVKGKALPGEQSTSESFERHTFVGWGCESFDCSPVIRITDFAALDPRDAADRRYAADRAATRLEDAVYSYIIGDDDWGDVRDRLSIAASEQRTFRAQLRTAVEQFDLLDGLLTEATPPVVVISHVPPYNTHLDRHHSIGEREFDLEGLHVGSLSLKLALRKHRPIAALSGHSHNGEYHVGIGDGCTRPHLLNLDFRGVVEVEVDGKAGIFGYTFHHDRR